MSNIGENTWKQKPRINHIHIHMKSSFKAQPKQLQNLLSTRFHYSDRLFMLRFGMIFLLVLVEVRTASEGLVTIDDCLSHHTILFLAVIPFLPVDTPHMLGGVHCII